MRGGVTSWGGDRPRDHQRRVETGNRGGTKRVGGDTESVGDGLSSPGQSRGGGVREGKGSGVWAQLQTESGRKDRAGTGPKPEDKGQRDSSREGPGPFWGFRGRNLR